MSSIVSALVAIFTALQRQVYTVRSARGLLGWLTESPEFEVAMDRLQYLQDRLENASDREAAKKEIEVQEALVDDLAPLPNLSHPGHAWVIEIIYDDVAVTNRADWARAGFTPPKVLILRPDTREECIQTAINLLALGRAVVAANAAYIRMDKVQFAVSMASANWDRLMTKPVEKDEFAARVSAKKRRIENWKKRVADA